MLRQDAEGLRDQRLVQVLGVEQDQGADPIDGLGDARRLAEVELAGLLRHRDDLGEEGVARFGHVCSDDRRFALGVRIVEEEMKAPAA